MRFTLQGRVVRFATLALMLAAPVRECRALDLNAVLREVATAAPALAARDAMRDAAQHRIAPAGAWAAPMLEAGVVNLPTTGRFDTDMMTMKMVGVEQRVPIGGARALARESATSAYDAARWDAAQARFSAFADAWQAYADAYHSGVAADAAAAHDQVMARMEAAAGARVSAGRGRIAEVFRAQAERARLGADREQARAEQRAALARLAALRGREAIDDTEVLQVQPEWLAPDSAAAWARAIGVAHPALRALDAGVARDRASAASMRRMRWPDLDLKASYGRRETLADGMKQDDMVSASVGVMLPIGFAGREGEQAQAMDAMARAGEAERRAMALDLRQQLAAARAQARVSVQRVQVLRDTVLVLQQRALDADWAAYASGSLDLSAVLETAHGVYAVQLELVRVHQELARALARVLAITADGSLVGLALPAMDARSSR